MEEEKPPQIICRSSKGAVFLVASPKVWGRRPKCVTHFERLALLRDLTVGAIAHPSANLADFYRKIGDLFGVDLKPRARWGAVKALRERWPAHLEHLRQPLVVQDRQETFAPYAADAVRLVGISG